MSFGPPAGGSWLGKHSTNALHLLQSEEGKTMIIPTINRDVDKILDGGLRLGSFTEVCGLPGVGKTCFCLQLCLNVQAPEYLTGLDGEAIYIGTNHSLSSTRLRQMAEQFVNRCNKVLLDKPPKKPQNLLTVEETLSRIHVARCCTMEELSDLLLSLDSFLEKEREKRVRIIVVDGIDFPMFTEKDSFRGRVKVLYNFGQVLYSLIQKFGVAVIVTNCMTTRFGPNGEQYYIPYLGESWSYVPNQILKFYIKPGDTSRKAEIVKSTYCKEGIASYRINYFGFTN